MTTIIILSLIVITLVLLIILVFTFNTFSKDVKNAKCKIQLSKYIKFEYSLSLRKNRRW